MKHVDRSLAVDAKHQPRCKHQCIQVLHNIGEKSRSQDNLAVSIHGYSVDDAEFLSVDAGSTGRNDADLKSQ